MKLSRIFQLAFVALALFISCQKNNHNTPVVPPEPVKPQVDPSQKMGKGELFNLLSAIPTISDIVAVRGEKSHSKSFDEEYEFYIEQNIDPENPAVGTFKQRARIAHIGFDAPMVLVTEGYALNDTDTPVLGTEYNSEIGKEVYAYQGEEIANSLKANILDVEHRYFYKSNPDKRDWKYLTTKNASADLHNIYMRPFTNFIKSLGYLLEQVKAE